MIVASQLVKSYQGKRVLRGLTLSSLPGEITLLVGPNGAGKSTTLRLLTGLAQPDGGAASVGGKDIFKHRLAAQRLLSFLPQTPSFHPRFTSRQIVDFYARLRGIGRPQREAVLDACGLREVEHAHTRILSGGLRQRLGLALLLLPDAPVLLLDEPGISLDPAWRRELQSLLYREARRGKTVLVSTHLIAEWNGVAHRCLLCHNGVIERELDPANLTDDFDDREGDPCAGASGAQPPGKPCAAESRLQGT